jgi:GT2 family glycosyltransferase/glycosyltransferase involved in cell wall biosynthesis
VRTPAIRKKLRILLGRIRLASLGAQRIVARALRLERQHAARLARIVRRSGLFDTAWYLEVNADVCASGKDPILHYVRFGDSEDRQPMPFFDPAFYRSNACGGVGAHNALVHYLCWGQYRRASPSAWFDVAFYLAQNRDVARSGEEPLSHYLREGGAAGRSPCRQFDAAFYLRSNPDVAASGLDPLRHYLAHGRLEGRPVMADTTDTDAPVAPRIPEERPQDWPDLIPLAGAGAPLVDVIVPVYKGRNETLRCIRSVLSSRNITPFELVVIDDVSPDDDLSAALEGLAQRGVCSLIRNENNVGFVSTANRGMGLHAGRDVVLLNSDTEVYGDWLDRLRGCAYRNPRIATVTPLSNNATIASYPLTDQDNPFPLDIPFSALDALTKRVNAGVEVETPTGIGFCMYLRRDCLDAIGLFDEEAFGKGYGEENDLCQRAAAAGWRNVITAEVFVHHLGSVSFQGERSKRVADAMRKMAIRYPPYHSAVQAFIAADPLGPARTRLDWARLEGKSRGSNTLLVNHSRGGGAERHVQDEMGRILASDNGVFFMRPVRGNGTRVCIGDSSGVKWHNIPDFTLADTETLAEALRKLRIDSIHVHGTVDFDMQAPAQLAALARHLGARLEVDVHDYQAICPRINLADEEGRYCGEPDERGCDACLATHGSKYGVKSIRDWREANAPLLELADCVYVPDQDVAERLGRYLPNLKFSLEPHEEVSPDQLRTSRPMLRPEEPLRVVVIGAIGKVKGYNVLLACARDAREKGLSLEFGLLGYSMNDMQLRHAGVSISGRYLEEEALERLLALDPHLVWLPSLWPETYSYTLSLGLLSGRQVCAFDIGAIARRLRELGRDELLMPLEMQGFAHQINRRFLAYRASHIAGERGVAGV